MIKKHKKFKQPTMRRTARIYIDSWINKSKADTVKDFLYFYHDLTQYFIDYFWSTNTFNSELATLPVVHRGRDKFSTTTRLSQSAAKQAKQAVNSAHELKGSKPCLHNQIADLCYHFVSIESFNGSFDLAVNLGGAGVPKITIPCKSNQYLNKQLQNGWIIGKSIRLGFKNKHLYIDLLLEKPMPPKRTKGSVVGLDSNYKHGFVTSNGDMYGEDNYAKIQTFSKRKKHTHKQSKDLIGQAIRSIDLSEVKVLVIESLKNVRSGTRGKFPPTLNRRLSHWLYAYAADLLQRRCEEEGVILQEKLPAYTSIFCRMCSKWNERNRRGDKFKCRHCGHEDQSDINAAKNLKLLGLAESYGIRSLIKSNYHII